MGLIFIDLKWYVWSWTLASSAHKKTLMFNWRKMCLREKDVAVSQLNLILLVWLNMTEGFLWHLVQPFMVPRGWNLQILWSPDFSSSTMKMLTSAVEIHMSPQLRDGLLWHFGSAVHGSQGMKPSPDISFNTPIKYLCSLRNRFPTKRLVPEPVLFSVLERFGLTSEPAQVSNCFEQNY